jgi:hypothetical protein
MRFRGGDVHGKAEDELETIDGREPRASAAAPGELIALPSSSPQVDYPELMTVERRHHMISGDCQALLQQRVPLRLDDDDVVRLTSEPPGHR